MILNVKVIPKAANNAIVGWEGKVLKVRLNAVPEKGKANQELIQFLSKLLKLPKQAFRLIRGHHDRTKQIQIDGITEETLKQKIEENKK